MPKKPSLKTMLTKALGPKNAHMASQVGKKLRLTAHVRDSLLAQINKSELERERLGNVNRSLLLEVEQLRGQRPTPKEEDSFDETPLREELSRVQTMLVQEGKLRAHLEQLSDERFTKLEEANVRISKMEHRIWQFKMRLGWWLDLIREYQAAQHRVTTAELMPVPTADERFMLEGEKLHARRCLHTLLTVETSDDIATDREEDGERHHYGAEASFRSSAPCDEYEPGEIIGQQPRH